MTFLAEKNALIGVIYRPPNSNLDNFLTYISATLDSMRKENKLCYVMGDFNLNLFNADKHEKTGEFVDVMFANHFLPLITKPTRVTQKSATLIDNIFTNNTENKPYQGIFYTDISDHFPILYTCSSLKISKELQYVTKRVYSEASINNFIRLIQAVDWNQVTYIEDPQCAYSLFHTEFHKAYFQAFPLKTFK